MPARSRLLQEAQVCVEKRLRERIGYVGLIKMASLYRGGHFYKTRFFVSRERGVQRHRR